MILGSCYGVLILCGLTLDRCIVHCRLLRFGCSDLAKLPTIRSPFLPKGLPNMAPNELICHDDPEAHPWHYSSHGQSLLYCFRIIFIARLCQCIGTCQGHSVPNIHGTLLITVPIDQSDDHALVIEHKAVEICCGILIIDWF